MGIDCMADEILRKHIYESEPFHLNDNQSDLTHQRYD